MTKLVRPSMSCFMALPISTSVRVSTLEVASSRIRMGGSQRNTPGNGQQLALAGGEVGGFVVQHRVIALGHGADEVVHHGGLGSGHNLLAGGVRLAVGNVFRHGTAKQPGVLENHAEVAAQPLRVISAVETPSTVIFPPLTS